MSVSDSIGSNRCADEQQTWMRQVKKKFITTVKKIPELENVDPEILWDALNKADFFKQLKMPPYRKL